MKLDLIFEEWEKDSKIDRTKPGEESLKIPQLHHKYFKIYTSERLLLRKYETDLKTLKREKFDFFIFGPTKETQEKGWALPPSGKILKADVNFYIDSDKDIIELTLKVGVQNEKIDLLESIIKTLSTRNFNIKNYIDWERFQVGA